MDALPVNAGASISTSTRASGIPPNCKECCSCPYRGPKVGSWGPKDAPVVFIAEAPGAEEIRSKDRRPLVGPSGKLFFGAFPPPEQLAAWGISLDRDILLLNAMQCLPPRTKKAQINAQRVDQGAHTCQARLLQEIQEHPRKLIVAMGNAAVRSVTNDWNLKITQIRGGLRQSNLAELGVLPVVHPAAILRGTGNYRQFRNDIHYAMDLLRGVPPRKPITPDVILCDTAAKVFGAMWAILAHTPAEDGHIYCSADVETTGLDKMEDELLSIGLAVDPRQVYIVPDRLIHLLRRLFRSPQVKCIWHNGKFDIAFLRRPAKGGGSCPEATVDEDTMLLSYALDETGGIHDLETVGSDCIGAEDWKYVIKQYVPKKSDSWRNIPSGVLYKYQAYDVSNTLQIWSVLRQQVREDKHLEKLYTRVLIPASEFLHRIEMNGIYVSPERLKANEEYYGKLVDQAKLVLMETAEKYGVEALNPNAPEQVAHILWDKLKLRHPDGLGERSTAKEILAKLPRHPFVDALKEYRRAAKLKATYIDGLWKKRRIARDGRVHTTYKIHGTRTGRLSSEEPNLQNIPRERRLRGQYGAAPGCLLLKVDANQAELRSLAQYSHDEFLCRVYNDPAGKSLHDEITQEFFSARYTPEDKAAKTPAYEESKMIAKNVNFGIVYGITEFGLAEQIKRTTREAADLIHRWFARCPGAKRFIDKCRTAAIEGRTLITVFGRKKRHYVVTWENAHMIQNEASNFPHQSSASDIVLLTGIEVEPLLRARGIKVVNIIHDELLMELPADATPELILWAKSLVIDTMQRIPRDWNMTRVPFKGEADIGVQWGTYIKGGVPEDGVIKLAE